MTTTIERIRTHPGEVLREEFQLPLGMSARRLAEILDTSHTTVAALLREDRSITADVAAKLSRAFGTSAQFWLNLQMSHDLSKVDQESLARVQVVDMEKLAD